MSKRILSMLLAALMLVSVLSLSACGDDGGSGLPVDDDGGDDENVLTAPDGSTVTLPKSVTKVITVSESAKAMIEALKASDKIVASYGADEDATSSIVSAKPEVVFYDEGSAIDVTKLTEADIVAVKITSADNVATIKKYFTFIGQVIGVSADSAVDSITKGLNTMQLSTAAWTKLNVYIELGSGEDGYYTVAPYSYVHELLSSAGGNNIFGADSDKQGFVTVTADEILAADPDVIFVVGSVDDVKAREGWSECKAVANGNVFTIDAPSADDSIVAFAQAINDKLASLITVAE